MSISSLNMKKLTESHAFILAITKKLGCFTWSARNSSLIHFDILLFYICE